LLQYLSRKNKSGNVDGQRTPIFNKIEDQDCSVLALPDPMERSEIVQEYFQLIVLLNRTNKLPDEKTKLHFTIIKKKDEELLFAYLIHPGPKQLLCHKSGKYKWVSSGFTQQIYFERYCAEFLDKHVSVANNLTELLAKHLASLLFTSK
jgi:hypothetical protein